jgi:hypothetical protein
MSSVACAAAAANPHSSERPPTPKPNPVAIPNLQPTPNAAAPPSPRWLKGNTHVHAKPSGDSTTPIPDVIAWYESHGYDFIALTDHNQVSELPGGDSTFGEVFVRSPDKDAKDGDHRLIVLSGIELTHNPATCLPPPPLPEGRCRIHVNAIGVTARPEGRLEWADRRSSLRIDLYSRALITVRELGGIAQLNHPQWHWGMNPDLLTELGRRGALLVEIFNSQFTAWNDGGTAAAMTFPSVETLWDAALAAGVTMWGVGTDDAHSYDGKGQYPAGGAWIMVDAPRQPRAILAALAAGAFYASTGVELERAGRRGDALVVEIAAASPGAHRIVFIENGRRVEEVAGRRAQRKLPARGFVRAVVLREDGARAWVQPVRASGTSGTSQSGT